MKAPAMSKRFPDNSSNIHPVMLISVTPDMSQLRCSLMASLFRHVGDA